MTNSRYITTILSGFLENLETKDKLKMLKMTSTQNDFHTFLAWQSEVS